MNSINERNAAPSRQARQAHQQNQTFLSPAAREEMLIVVEWEGFGLRAQR